MASKLKDTKIQVVIPSKTKSSAKSINTVRFAGDSAKSFTEIANKIKSLAAEKDDLEEELKDFGVKELIKLNCESGKVNSSVRVIDDSEGVVTVTLKNAYSAPTATVVEKICEELVIDPNDYFQTVIKYAFNQNIFYKADGSFNEKVYRAIRRAVAEKVAELIDAGDLSADVEPFSEDKVVSVKPSFHEERWALGVEANTLIQDSIPAQVAIKVG